MWKVVSEFEPIYFHLSLCSIFVFDIFVIFQRSLTINDSKFMKKVNRYVKKRLSCKKEIVM